MQATETARPAEHQSGPVQREKQLQRLVTVYIVTGLLFMLLPGTFLGVWNLLLISAEHTVETLPPAWLQAHGHAQIFGWLGTFILGIGFYSLSKMGSLPAFAVSRGWLCFVLWTCGVSLRWTTNVTGWHWRILLPFSAALEFGGFLLFLVTVSNHRPAVTSAPRKKEAWMLVVVASTVGFFATLLINLGVALNMALRGDSPAVPFLLDQRLLILPVWAFLVPTVWGFNARWLPVSLGLRHPGTWALYAAVVAAWTSVIAMLCGFAVFSAAVLPLAAVSAIAAFGIFEHPVQSPKLNGVHATFPLFIRAAYVWLFIASTLSLAAALADQRGGIWGASRHALTVGFLAVMVFAIGPKILPAFCGARILFSPRLMFASLVLLNAGCLLRVSSEILAYEGYAARAWQVLPVSAVIELTAVSVFALNLIATLLQPPAHLLGQPCRRAA